MIQTNVFVSHFSGAKADIDPNATISPNGMASKSVTIKITQLSLKPSSSEVKTSLKIPMFHMPLSLKPLCTLAKINDAAH